MRSDTPLTLDQLRGMLEKWKCGICEVPTHWVEWYDAGYMYCPYCGRPLMKESCEKLQKRLEGINHA